MATKRDDILNVIEATRSELLDTSLSNRLLNYRLLKTRGVEIVDGDVSKVFRALVTEGKSLRFRPRRDSESSQSLLLIAGSGEPPNSRDRTIFLDSDDSGNDLAARLLNTYRLARSSLQETGVNFLFLAMGMLRWYEADSSTEPRFAPLVLVPVQLEREGATQRFRVRYTGEDLGVNHSLIERAKEFHIQLPGQEALDPADGRDIDAAAYIAKVTDVVRRSAPARWAVEPNRMALGFFSFHKFLMWRDLDNAVWEAAGAGIHTNEIIAALYGDGFREPPSDLPGDDRLDERLHPEKVHHVLDADSSQTRAIHDAAGGRNMVIQGPPGTGKSQTIVNLLAEAVAGGKRVLFVSEKSAAMEVVKRRMDNIGLGRMCLELHSDKATTRQVIEELKAASQGHRQETPRPGAHLDSLAHIRNQLNEHARQINTAIGVTGVSPYDAMGQLLLLGDTGSNPLRWQSFQGIWRWSGEDFTRKRRQVEELRLRLGDVGIPNQHPFYGVGLREWTPSIEQDLADNLTAADRSIVALEDAVAALADALPPIGRPTDISEAKALRGMARLAEEAPDLGGLNLSAPQWRTHSDQISRLLRNGVRRQEVRRDTDTVAEAAAALASRLPPANPPKSAAEAQALLRLAQLAEDAPNLSGLDLAAPQWRTHSDQIGRLLENGARRQKIHAEFDNAFHPYVWGRDFSEVRHVLNTTGRKLFGRLFSFRYKRARRQLIQILDGHFPRDVDEQIGLLDTIAEEAQLSESIVADGAAVSGALSDRWAGLQTDWHALESVIHWWTERAAKASTEVVDVLQRAADNGGAPSLSTDLIPLCTKWAALEAEAAELNTAIMGDGAIVGGALATQWAELDTDWEALAPSVQWWVQHANRASDEFISALKHRVENATAPSLADSIAEVSNALRTYTIKYEKALTAFEWDKTSPYSDFSKVSLQLFSEQRGLLQHWLNHLPTMNVIVQFSAAGDSLIEAGLNAIVNLAETHPDAERALTLWFKRAWYEFILETALIQHHELQTFNRSVHEDRIRTFRSLDEQMLKDNRYRVAKTHQVQITDGPLFTQGSRSVAQFNDIESLKQQRQILRNLFVQRRPRRAIRRLLREAGQAVQVLTPVFMMSPLSIAKFLEPGKVEFDLVVFDEASQVRPGDAIGALLRAKKAVVVGDSKQLPPTSFFDRTFADQDGVDVDDDDTQPQDTQDIESILGRFEAKQAHARKLKFHYRSRHESLIAVSNALFYGDRLVVLPSPDAAREHMGLQYRYLPDTAYDRGRSSTNVKEAEAVAYAVMEHAKESPKQSLGVAAFSSAQARAIENRVEALRIQDLSAEDFFNAHPEEPFFVKNLETVQGDERDVIYISIGYGKDANGRITQNFGPLNRDGGQRRLNVLITRAKHRCIVFTNLHESDVEAANEGTKALKTFLAYAESGQMPTIAEATDREVDSPFQQAVAQSLEAQGYSLRQEVGVGGYFIDIAIIDPEHPGRYVIGIECDGASYHSSKTARDRDRIREAHLRSLGWELHRIWSTDWWNNPQRELNRCVEAIERVLIRA